MFSEIFHELNNCFKDDWDGKEAGAGTVKDNMDDLCDVLEDEILKGKSSEEEKKEALKRLRTFCNTKTNIMLVGATGCGKSSTINALFSIGVTEENADEEEPEDADEEASAKRRSKPYYVEVAKVGSKSDPETKDTERYTIGNLTLWDTPGLGDGTEIDEHHKEVISELLMAKDEEGNALIDLVLLVLDGSTRDLGTSYKILNEVILPKLGKDTDRILVALNQADIAMKTGRHWDYEKNEPDETLVEFLNEKVESIQKRIKEDSGLEITPVYYCAGYEEPSGDVVRPYNLSKLLYYIMQSLPAQKRVAVMEGINTDAEQFESNDDEEDYNEGIKDSFYDAFDFFSDGVESGAEIGETILGIPGAIIGGVVGGVVGGILGILDEIF